MADQTLLDVLYNELINLDEMSGCFDEITNIAIDFQREKLSKQIKELEAA